MELRPGLKLHSAVSDAEVVVVKAPSQAVEIGCGGVSMYADGEEAPAGAALEPASGEGPLLGKRYADDDLGLELLCTKAGDGGLSVDGQPLGLKGAKPLPSSD